MVYTYKNFIIIDREDKVVDAIKMAKNMGVWFSDDDRVWHIKNVRDKVIIIYKELIGQDEIIKEYNSSVSIDFKTGTFVGFIHIYCNGTNVKVSKFNFTNVDTTMYWEMFKKYLVHTINTLLGQSLVKVPVPVFTLYWDSKVCTNEINTMGKIIGLMSDNHNRTYVFTEADYNSCKSSGWGGIVNSNSWGNNWNI
jgi:hypothetical protein